MNNQEFQKLLVDNGLIVPAGSGYAFNVQSINNGMTDFINPAITKAFQVVHVNARKVLGWNIINKNEYTVYVKFYNSAASDVNTDVPLMIIAVPPAGASGDPVNSGFVFQEPNCVQFLCPDGLSVRACKELTYTDDTAIATPIYVSAKYTT